MGGFGAIVFEIPLVEMMVVNEASIEKQSAVRLQDASEGDCGISRASPGLFWTRSLAFQEE